MLSCEAEKSARANAIFAAPGRAGPVVGTGIVTVTDLPAGVVRAGVLLLAVA
jgi:hypothetical protein